MASLPCYQEPCQCLLCWQQCEDKFMLEAYKDQWYWSKAPLTTLLNTYFHQMTNDKVEYHLFIRQFTRQNFLKTTLYTCRAFHIILGDLASVYMSLVTCPVWHWLVPKLSRWDHHYVFSCMVDRDVPDYTNVGSKSDTDSENDIQIILESTWG